MAKNKKLCICKGCTNKPKKGKRTCQTCTRKKWRLKNPEKYAYYTLRYNARRRKKIFTISFDYFLQFVQKYSYMTGKGKKRDSLSIDCIVPELGYTEGNIQALPLADNSRKGTKLLVYDWRTKEASVVKFESVQNNIQNPF